MKYTVLAYEDNFQKYRYPEERITVGTYDTEQEAKKKCRSIVEGSVKESFRQLKMLKYTEITAKSLYSHWDAFGCDPFIESGGFSASQYASEYCEKLCELLIAV